jgi:hypothetical protein
VRFVISNEFVKFVEFGEFGEVGQVDVSRISAGCTAAPHQIVKANRVVR